jgi:hypothetical protein
VEEQAAANAFTWYVDQTTEQLIFKSAGNSMRSIALFTINGAKVLDLDNLDTQELSVSKSAYASGLYIAQLTTVSGGVQTLKIVL